MTTPLVSPTFLRRVLRGGMRRWAHTAIRGGWFYQRMESLGPRLGETTPLEGRLPNGARVDCRLDDHVQRHLYFYGAYEPLEAFLFTRMIALGDIVVDAGANIGQYTLLASTAVGPTGRVHSFEPVPATFRMLTEHVTHNGFTNVNLNHAALWHEETTLDLGLSDDMVGNIGSFSIGTKTGPQMVRSKAIKFDDYAVEHISGRVAVIKMDIEGAELFALRGMRRTLEKDRPLILSEINQAACVRLGYTARDLWNLLAGELGYRVWRIGNTSADWTELAAPDGIVQANVIFTPGALPPSLTAPWTLKGAIRWAGRPS